MGDYSELNGSKRKHMTKLMIDVPPDKMKSFSKAISTSEFTGRTLISRHERKRSLQIKPSISHLKRIASSFILFDWEFFSNELEYE